MGEDDRPEDPEHSAVHRPCVVIVGEEGGLDQFQGEDGEPPCGIKFVEGGIEAGVFRKRKNVPGTRYDGGEDRAQAGRRKVDLVHRVSFVPPP